MVAISASVLNVEKENSAQTFYNLETSGIDYFHIDVMDGDFVEQNTVTKMMEYTSIIKQISNIPIDVHLMVRDIEAFVEYYIPFAPNRITIHYEADRKEKILEQIKKIKENEIKVGISVKPNTKIEEIFPLLPFVHMCLIMTVEPGRGGQELIPSTIEKIEKLKEYIEKKQLEVDIEVDGGINLQTAAQVKKAGANILVVGTALIQTENYKEMVAELKKE